MSLVCSQHVVGKLGAGRLPLREQLLLGMRFEDEVGLECRIAFLAKRITPSAEAVVQFPRRRRSRELVGFY
jgi:hypothetical protein